MASQCALAALTISLTCAAPGAAKSTTFRFDLVRTPALSSSPNCAPDASGTATIVPGGEADSLTIKVKGLPPKTTFDVFVIQVPNSPFGMSWYQGDIDTNGHGTGSAKFLGRFSIETFTVAPGVASAPATFDNAFPSVTSNPSTGPVQMYHVGIWFDSPGDASMAGCPSTVTPFNGPHDAGVQLLNTSNFPDGAGPLSNVQ